MWYFALSYGIVDPNVAKVPLAVIIIPQKGAVLVELCGEGGERDGGQ